MSKSLTRVRTALGTAGLEAEIGETALARTARDAADAISCDVDQIAKSIIFQGAESGTLFLFLTAGGHAVDMSTAQALASEPLNRADANTVRARTGFAIGGVAPIGHLEAPRAFLDRRLLDFPIVWAAAGTPHHVFGLEPTKLAQISNAQISDFSI
jgi:prolyl-tRNA editing enzyme YbaK/EbsC (Cys-tRNA(Pro) deacylase)